MKSKIILTIGFSILFLVCGCLTWKKPEVEWLLPESPKQKPVVFYSLKANSLLTPLEDIIFANLENSKNLTYNIDEMDAYIRKLEEMVQVMKKYYEGK